MGASLPTAVRLNNLPNIESFLPCFPLLLSVASTYQLRRLLQPVVPHRDIHDLQVIKNGPNLDVLVIACPEFLQFAQDLGYDSHIFWGIGAPHCFCFETICR